MLVQQITLHIPLRPKPSPRPRTNGFMPRDYMNWKKQFGLLVPYTAKKSFDVPLAVFAVFIFARPKSHKPGNNMVPVGDSDNLTKAVLDALQDCGVIKNDRQVVHLTAIKRYGSTDGIKIALGEPPRWVFD